MRQVIDCTMYGGGHVYIFCENDEIRQRHVNTILEEMSNAKDPHAPRVVKFGESDSQDSCVAMIVLNLLAGFIVHKVEKSSQERAAEAIEKIANDVSSGEDWKKQ